MSGNTQQKKEAPKKKGLTNTLKYSLVWAMQGLS